MNREKKEQWLYEEYQYTSNFDFSRLDKYEEANDDLCIDDLILDYTMLYELYKQEIERLKNIIKEVRELVNKALNINSDYVDYEFGVELLRQELLEILDKGKE